MALPNVGREDLLAAIRRFETELQPTPDWAGWESDKTQVYVIEHGGKTFPPKKIVSLATGIPVGQFKGGPETNSYLEARGFTVKRLRDVRLSDVFVSILERYKSARSSEPFKGHHEIRELFAHARRTLENFEAVSTRTHLSVHSSYGKGRWATIPWISILDDRETRTTQKGFYVVYLFKEDGSGIYLKVAEGVTAVAKQHGAAIVDVLSKRAASVRQFCVDLAGRGFDLSGHADLGTDQRLGRLYDASTAAAKFYPKDQMADDGVLQADLEAALGAYEKYVASKGVDARVQEDDRPLALIGTWRDAVNDVPRISAWIAAHGAWASWWSFPIRDDATDRLKAPFHLYAYGGDWKVPVRVTVGAVSSKSGQGGIESPWPECTEEEVKGLTKKSSKQSEVFKTWLKVVKVERLDPAWSVDDFELAVGLSTSENLINQNTLAT